MSLFRKKRKVMFSSKNHPFDAILSSISGVICLIVTLCLFIGSSKAKGHAPVWYGFVGMVVMIDALVSLFFSLRSMKKQDIYLLFPRIGTTVNGFLVLMFLVLICLGV